jgi:predicted nucleic-acid-binding protein
MIGLDTNILVRYLAQDDAIRSPKAREIIERRLTEGNPGFVSIVVMVETVWVLERAYGLTIHEIAGNECCRSMCSQLRTSRRFSRP